MIHSDGLSHEHLTYLAELLDHKRLIGNLVDRMMCDEILHVIDQILVPEGLDISLEDVEREIERREE